MCGINGIFGLSRLDQPEAIVKKMNRTLSHRGPDANGTFAARELVLGHQRLSIIDTTDAANQPFYSHDSNLVIVFNGEIYNYRELKDQLSDYPFRTSSDTEVILAAYEKWGRACLQKFNGMFAFAIWDKSKGELFIARDRLGIKPLYYADVNSHFVFSSEVRPILESGIVERKTDTTAIADFLRYQTVHAPNTIVKDIKMLMPGHYVVLNDNETIFKKYWDVTQQFSRKSAGQSRSEILTDIRESMLKSVDLRLRADVPFGAFLSGGIDSSAIVGLMSEVATKRVSTFNVAFDEAEFSEAKYARMVADKFKTDHHEIQLNPRDFLDLLPDALNAMDHPSGDGPNTFVVSKMTKQAGITMALSGLGGDELFAGYDVFKRLARLSDKKWLMSFPKFMRNFAMTFYRAAKPSIASDKIAEVLKQDYLDIDYTFPINRLVLFDRQVKKLISSRKLPPNEAHRLLHENIAFGNPGFDMPYLSKISWAEMNTYMQNVLLRDSDQMSMAHALEVRVPFLDHNLVEYVMGIGDQQKYPHTQKELLVDAMGDLLPREIVDRPKMGFVLPWENWMKDELREFCSSYLEALGQRKEFNARAIDDLWKRFLSNDPKITWSRIWPLVVLSHWLDKNKIDV
ncbi:asparagine synthase (glutamine-hydrolyzing) [Halocola ammonii]